VLTDSGHLLDDHRQIVDLGQNINGWIRLEPQQQPHAPAGGRAPRNKTTVVLPSGRHETATPGAHTYLDELPR
jgi:hypothetical protein